MTEKGLVTETVKESGGYMVYFPRGHSIRVRTDDELRRLGFADPAALIDMETGEAHGTALQRASLIASAQSKSGRAALMKQSLARDTDAGEKEGVE